MACTISASGVAWSSLWKYRMSIVSTPSRFRLASTAVNAYRRDRPRALGPGPVGLASLVAITHQSRCAAIARPVISSLAPSL